MAAATCSPASKQDWHGRKSRPEPSGGKAATPGPSVLPAGEVSNARQTSRHTKTGATIFTLQDIKSLFIPNNMKKEHTDTL